jgi:carboxypeptidase Q
MKPVRTFAIAVTVAATAAPLSAQTFRNEDPVIRRIWQLGMDSSQLERLSQVLMDSIGPRLSGTAGFANAGEWLERSYRSWGITARRERYGTWRGWRAGTTHMQLTAPRHQDLEVELLAWSTGTGGRPVEGEVVVVPELADPEAAAAWLRTVRGRYVLISPPEVTCRAAQELERWARPATVERLREQRRAAQQAYVQRLRQFFVAATPSRPAQTIAQRLDSAGAAGVLTSFWSGGWGVNKVFDTPTARIPAVDVSCEDYGLLFRLASNNQGPRIRLTIDAQSLSDQPMFNVIAELRGTVLPEEYVLLSAHLDSWHAGTGATDNGTGTVMMLEAMRILARAYPNPRRTILVGHWGGEEQGLIGSGSFAEDHPEVIAGLQAVFNQDNGTWRADTLEAQGFALAGINLARWVSQLPGDLADHLRLVVPGPQANPGSDHSTFVCRDAPAFRLQSAYPEYRQYTWHTNRDTWDKIVFDDLRNNAVLVAMLAYAASEDPERVSRERSLLPPGPSGQPRRWPSCGQPRRSYQPR